MTDSGTVTEFQPWHADSRLPTNRPFTVAQAREAGVDGNVLARLVRQGLLRRVVRGIYVDAAVPDSLEERARALALAVPEASVITDVTAAWLYGFDVLPPESSYRAMPMVHFFRLPDHTRVRRSGVVGGRRSLDEADVRRIGGLLVTTPLRTACDLGRLLQRERALGALDGLLGTGDFTRNDLLSQVERFRGRRGVVQLRELAPLADGRSESVKESALRLLWLDAGLPLPELQIPILDRYGQQRFRLDLGDSKVKYAAEFDGEEWHSTPEQIARDAWRRGLIRGQGWTIDVFTSPDLDSWASTTRLRDGYQRAVERSRSAPNLTERERSTRAFGRPRYADDFFPLEDMDAFPTGSSDVAIATHRED